MRRINLKKLPKLAVAMALIVGVSFTTSIASTIEDAQQTKQEAEGNKKEAQAALDEMEKAQDEIIASVKKLDGEVTALQEDISANKIKQGELEKEIETTNGLLAAAQVNEDQQYANMKKRIQYLYENGEVEYIDTIMSSASFADMLNKSEYISQLSKYDQKQLEKLIETKDTIAKYEKTLEKDLEDVQYVETQLLEQEEALEEAIGKKKEQIAKYDKDIANQTTLVNKYAEEERKAEDLIAKYEAAAIAAQQNSGTVIYDTSSYKGKLGWPVPSVAYGKHGSGFGPRVAPVRGASTYHKGIDIGCAYGCDIVAAESGTVVIAQYSSSAGNYVMIDHGSGVSTVYMHNSSLCVGVGQKVTKGQVIAKAGSTGYSTGPHCHFGVKINGTYVNPDNYF